MTRTLEQRLGFDGWHDLPRLGPCPIGGDVVVRVRFRDHGESHHTYAAKQLRWDRFKGQKAPLPFDIIAYKIEGKA